MISEKTGGLHRKNRRGRAMGGYGSGQQGGCLTVEDCLSLDLNKLLRDRCLVPGRWKAGSLHWTVVGTGREVASVGYAADLADPAAAWMRLRFGRGEGKARREHECTVRLTTTRPCFGGRRWWFVCPVSGRRCGKLHIPPGAGVFAARQVWGLAYTSQRVSPLERERQTAADRASRLRRRLGGTGGGPIGHAEVPPRPKGMWRRTYERRRREIEEVEERLESIFWEKAAILGERR